MYFFCSLSQRNRVFFIAYVFVILIKSVLAISESKKKTTTAKYAKRAKCLIKFFCIFNDGGWNIEKIALNQDFIWYTTVSIFHLVVFYSWKMNAIRMWNVKWISSAKCINQHFLFRLLFTLQIDSSNSFTRDFSLSLSVTHFDIYTFYHNECSATEKISSTKRNSLNLIRHMCGYVEEHSLDSVWMG